jgi:hypothetical protein
VSETPPKLNLDAALRAWPEAEKSPVEWDEWAASVVARARSADAEPSSASVSDENLLADPLGQTEEDGHNSAAPHGVEVLPMTMPADRERDRRSLQDLAKMAQMTPPPSSVGPASAAQHAPDSKKDDSGIVDLAAASASDPHGAMRAQSTPLASAGLFDEDPASVRQAAFAAQPAPSMPPMPASMPPASMPPASMPPASFGPASAAPYSAPMSMPAHQASSSVSSSMTAAAPQKKGSGAVIALVVGGVVALTAAAAGGFLYVRSHAPASEPAAATTPAETPAAAAPIVEAAPAKEEETEEVAANDESEETLDSNDLPSATGAKVASAKATLRTPSAKPEAKAAAKAEPKEEAAKISQKDLPTAAAGSAGGLGDEMAKAVGANDGQPAAVPAAGNAGPAARGNVPQKPSQGAVTGALGAVLPQARACLGPDDPISRASVVFASSGAVESVKVSGHAAGKPAEGCIKTALSRAKLTPFAEASYTAPVTIRP